MLITAPDGAPYVSHLPFLFEASSTTQGKLLGHMARANPQWQDFEKNDEVLVIFQGPHAYVSPSWYTSPGVPTWNYAIVHVQGKARITQTDGELENLLQRLTAEHETDSPSSWKPELDEQRREKLFGMIVGFEIEITDIKAKFKLSQNRPPEDQQNVTEKLSRSQDQTERAVALFMQEIYRTK